MECRYKIVNDPSGKSYSYEELVKEVIKRDNISDSLDIVFSKDASQSLQDSIYSKIMSVRAQGFVKQNTSYIDGEPIISDDHSKSLQEFIDMPLFTYNGRRLITKMSDKTTIVDDIARALVNESKGTMSEEQAKYIARQEVEHWNIIAKDATDLHTLISSFSFSPGTKSDFLDHLKDTKFKKSAGELYDSVDNFMRKTLGKISQNAGGLPSRVIRNINLKSKVDGIDLDIFGHIDMIVIDGLGDLHIFNYKVSTHAISSNETKLIKYRYQMALLRQMLASHGISVKKATLNIVPIRVKYNDDYSQIESTIMDYKPTELTFDNGKYVFKNYDAVAKHFIRAEIGTDRIISEDRDIADEQLKLIFPDRDVKVNGVRLTAEEWIKKNKTSIIESNDPEFGYVIDFGDGTKKKIKSHEKPENNQEIYEAVLEHQEALNPDSEVFINRLIKSVRGGMRNGMFSFTQDLAYSRSAAYLNHVFKKYFPPSKDTSSDWSFLENDVLNSAGIMLFAHKNGQLDVVALSPYDLTVKGFNRDHILGKFLRNTKAGSLINYRPTFGNIEAIKTMVLLNQVLPKLEGDFTLGKLHVLSLQGNGQGVPFNLETLNKECFSNILETVNSNFPNTKIKNNLVKYKFLDRIDILIQEYKAIVDELSSSESQELIDTGFEGLNVANGIEAKLNALRQIQAAMVEAYPGLEHGALRNVTKNISNTKIALLYQRVVDAIAYYDVGDISTVERKLSGIDRHVFISSRVPNRNFRLVTSIYTRAINNIAEQAEAKWISMRDLFFKFYDDIGYSRVQNSTIGNQASQFNDLYRKDRNGNRTLRLLNPYDENDMAQIKTHRGVKQQFLKKILFEFAKIRYPMRGIKFNFTSESDPALQRFIENHGDYFDIPLEKASISTRRQKYSLRQKLKYIGDKAKEIIRDPKRGFEEFVNDVVNKREQELRDQAIESKHLTNKFLLGEGNNRQGYLADHDVDYFETNLENLMADFIERDIETREYNKALITIKGILFQLDLLGENPNQAKVVEQTKEMIENFIKVNMFNASIMDETSQRILGVSAPLRHVVSNTLIAGNVISMLRDAFEGIWQNTMRVLNHYQTDIDAKSLSRAYVTVVKNSFSDGRTINIVNQLCQIYRLSNIDVSRISEGLKSERGAMNFKNWMYATLRRPDFLNRMTLFVAKCYKDGVYNAFDIKDGRLVYDWKKDERFKVFASGNKSDKRYKEQMGAYYNAVRAYNQDHPEATIGFDEDLPMPYSFQEVEVMKNVANSIYGSYDKSTRAGYEHMALGTFFGMFSTWMNGIYANYMTKPGQYENGEFELQQAKDSSGNLLFFDDTGQTIVQILQEDGTAKYYYEGTNTEVTENLTNIQKVMDKVPIVVQGIWYTVTDSLQALTKGNFRDEIWLDPVQRKNLDKLFSDLLALLLFSIIYGCVLNPAYKGFKEGMKERDVVTNGVVELLYKSSSRSYDGFKGIYNVFQFLGENTNPPVYTQNMKLLKELTAAAMGKKSAVDVLTGNVAVFKTFQDTYRTYTKSQEKNEQ